MPLLGGFLSYALGDREIPVLGSSLVLTQFTAPAFFLAGAAVVLLGLLYFVFQDGELLFVGGWVLTALFRLSSGGGGGWRMLYT